MNIIMVVGGFLERMCRRVTATMVEEWRNAEAEERAFEEQRKEVRAWTEASPHNIYISSSRTSRTPRAPNEDDV